MVKLEVEYCGRHETYEHYESLQNFLRECKPELDVLFYKGRRDSFEVKIDDKLVFSKLERSTFPDEDSILENINRAEMGEPLSEVKEEPQEKCVLL